MLRITGYSDKYTSFPGEEIKFYVKAEKNENYEVQIRPRSGLAAKSNITVLNTPGTIDSDYRGEIKVIIYNHGNTDFVINNGDRIAQMVLSPVIRMELEEVKDLPKTIRGEGGFGSTGKWIQN